MVQSRKGSHAIEDWINLSAFTMSFVIQFKEPFLIISSPLGEKMEKVEVCGCFGTLVIVKKK